MFNSEHSEDIELTQMSSEQFYESIKHIEEDRSEEKDLDKLMKKEYTYPEVNDEQLQYKLYKKREFYPHKIPERPDINDYNDIKDYRDNVCGRSFTLHEHQSLLSNFINPDTPYKGVIIFHGLGTGKTCAGIAIAEKFKSMVQKYNTKIHILVSGPLIKESWKHHLLKCTGETYLKSTDNGSYVDEVEKERNTKLAMMQALQYYKFMSYRSFYKRVLGEKIVDRKVTSGDKTKVSYRKTEEGEFERDIAVDRIHSLNNTLIIVDEAHNLTGNAYGEALKKIIDNSINLKIVLMSATPMKNLAHDIVELINFIRPKDSPMERDKIFNINKNHLMELKPGGLDYFKKMASGYISHVRGADPLIFAKRVDMGTRPKGLIFTKVVQCVMLPFQRKAYDGAIKEAEEDALDRKSEAVANFSFPTLSNDRKELYGSYGKEGLTLVKNQLKIAYDQLNKRIATEIFQNPNEQDLIYLTQDGKTVTGKIFKQPYLKLFSIKFAKALKKLNRLVVNKKGSKTAFVYSNLVKIGIDLFQEVLLQNGYLEYQEDSSNYQLTSETRCYYCGKTYGEHVHKSNRTKQDKNDTETNSESDANTIVKVSESSTEYGKKDKKDIPEHKFYPATFVSITGKSSEEGTEIIPEDKMRILKTVFSHIENKEGKFIKFVLGSKVMNEGISLENVGEVHILDVYFNLGKVDQTIGRAIRFCSHYKLMNEENVFPEVKVYKYVVSLGNDNLSSEEELYQKAELKYMLIKKIERAMKEVAVDCPLNMYGNMFKEEIEEFKNCGEDGHEQCPTICDYQKCNYKCSDLKLNAEFYDPTRNIYKKITKDNLDYSTFTQSLARGEIEYAKIKIKELYVLNYMYTARDILKYVKQSYNDEKRELFDDFFIFKALDELIPITENDFNSFKDTVFDKDNRAGYLIYVDKYYIFQPFDQNEDVPMYYRTKYVKPISQSLSLYNYLKTNIQYQNYKDKGKRKEQNDKHLLKDDNTIYDFDTVMDYYDSRDEFKYVGIIDKELSRRKTKNLDEIKDVFKIREKRAKVLEKKRGTGIPSLKGAVCSTAKNKSYLEKIGKLLGLTKMSSTRTSICEQIKDKMLYMEKYSTEADKNKLTYVMIPSNHPLYPFPYNLEDRIEYIKEKINKEIKFKLDLSVKTKKKADGLPSYEIHIKDNSKLKDYESFLKSLNATLKSGIWTIEVN
uniref:Helicase ATP-binding domain-containing protein n=1 Tax=viral metagenome TaxID=1070528 RepID=A0A6C0EB41_9ZZZZ